MANEFYYPWYPAHYRRDAGHLDHVSDSCYRRLLDAYMEGGEPIKKDAVRLMFIMRVSPEQFSLVWPQIEGFFVLDQKGYLHHKRCEVELDRQDNLTKHKSLGGIRSAAKRKAQRDELQRLANSSSTAVQQQPEHQPTALPPREGNVSKCNEILENHKNGSPPPDPIPIAVSLYLENAEKFSWPKIADGPLAQDRRTKLISRLEECGGIDGWRTAMDKAAQSSFLTGRSAPGDGHENWKPTFDFFLIPARFRKLMEGGYDDRKTNGNGHHPSGNSASGFAGVRAEARPETDSGGQVHEPD